MKIKFMVAATLIAALVTTTCGNSNKQSQSEKRSWQLRRH